MLQEAVLPSPAPQLISRHGRPANAPRAGTRDRVFGVTESWAASLALAVLIGFHIVYAFVYRVDSDEPQHLHVVWGWAHGLLQYRDLFDNHSPLFQMLCAPLFWALGEHAWILIPMRLAMLPLYAADAWLIYLIGSALYVRRWGVWTAIVAVGIPTFFLMTTQFRTDDLWTTLWLAVVYLAVSGPVTGRRAFIFGLAMGICFAVSMKTTLLLISMLTGFVGVLTLQALSRRKTEWSVMLKSAGLILAGMVIVPALLIGFFAAHGALRQMAYCVIQHNALPGFGKWNKPGVHQWLFPLSLPLSLGLGWLCMHSSADARIGAGRALILITGVAYYFLLRSYWPLVTAQDLMPLAPLEALTVLPFLFHLMSLTGWRMGILVPAAGVLLLGCEAAQICERQSPLHNRSIGFEQDLAVVLRLTNPDDLVMDGKGETIFRMRPIYWVLEGVTLRRIELGLIPDEVKEKIVETGTCVVLNHRLGPKIQNWLRANFLQGDRKVWVAGENLGSARPAMTFHTDIKARYSIVSEKGKLAGRIDGSPIQESQEIAPGDHRLDLTDLTAGTGNVTVLWTQALQRGFKPTFENSENSERNLE